MMLAIIKSIRAAFEDRALYNYLHRRTLKHKDETLIRRKSDGAWFTAGHPQDFGRCMAGMFSAKPRSHFHFYRVRPWRGMLISSPKIFWRPTGSGREFEIVRKGVTMFETGRLPEKIENLRIDEMEVVA